MERIRFSSRAAARPRRAGPKLCAAAVAAVFLAGCGVSRAPAQLTAARPVTSTVERWGSFFADGIPNTDTAWPRSRSACPAPVAQVGSSNSTEYALLTNGRLYAWGLGAQGELGNGAMAELAGQGRAREVPRRGEDRLHPHRRHALRHGPGRRHQGPGLGLG